MVVLEQFALGGIACMTAACVTNPVDVVKTRLQLQGELQSAAAPRKYKGLLRGVLVVAREEGVLALYKGLFPSLLREGSYSTMRMGLYEPLRDLFASFAGTGEAGLVAKISGGLMAGAVGAAIANPTDRVKVRMQAQGNRYAYKNTRDAFMTIWRSEGLAGLYRGVGPTTQRAMLLTATQLASYDHIKRSVLRLGVANEGTPLHFTVSMIAGLLCATVTAPVDNIKTRYMNQPFDAFGNGALYSSTADCFAKTLRAEGVRGLFKGWLPNWMRIGPHTIVTFVVLERLRALLGMKPV